MNRHNIAQDQNVPAALRGGCGLKHFEPSQYCSGSKCSSRPSGRLWIETPISQNEKGTQTVPAALRGGCGLKRVVVQDVGANLRRSSRPSGRLWIETPEGALSGHRRVVPAALRGGCGLKPKRKQGGSVEQPVPAALRGGCGLKLAIVNNPEIDECSSRPSGRLWIETTVETVKTLYRSLFQPPFGAAVD